MFLWDLWTVILVQILKRIILILQGNDSHKFVVVQSLSRVRLFVIPWTAVRLASLSFSIPEFAQTCICWVGDATIYLILCCPFLLLPSVFPSNRLFSNESALRTSGGQSIGVSASASVFPMNIQGCFLLRLTGLISLQSKGLSRVFSNSAVRKYQFFSAQSSLWSNSHICTWLLEKP